jgi:hypothetical protein
MIISYAGKLESRTLGDGVNLSEVDKEYYEQPWENRLLGDEMTRKNLPTYLYLIQPTFAMKKCHNVVARLAGIVP